MKINISPRVYTFCVYSSVNFLFLLLQRLAKSLGAMKITLITLTFLSCLLCQGLCTLTHSSQQSHEARYCHSFYRLRGAPLIAQYSWASLVAQLVRNSPEMRDTWVQSLGWEDPLEKGKVTQSCILAWRIPWTKQPMGSQRVRHDEQLFLTYRLRNCDIESLNNWFMLCT